MARLLVQLKLRLLLNALRASTGAKVAFVLSTDPVRRWSRAASSTSCPYCAAAASRRRT